MNELFKDIEVAGIVKPGSVYFFFEHSSRGQEIGPIEYACPIVSDCEILPAIEMVMCIMLAESYELRRFLGWRKLSDDCYKFSMLCYEFGEEREIEYYMYMHRLLTFEERLRCTKELWGIS